MRQNQFKPSEHSIKQPSVLPIEVDERIYVLNQKEIIALSVNNGKTTLHTLNRDYETTEPLNNYAKRLDDTQFLRIHRSTIINVDYCRTMYTQKLCVI